MKVKIYIADLQKTIDVEVKESSLSSSIKQMVMDHRNNIYEFKDYECSINNTIEEEISFIKVTLNGCQLEDSKSLKEYGIKNGDILYCRGSYPKKTYFICTAPNINFQFVDYYPKTLKQKNIGEFKQYLYQQLGSNCTISLKEIGTSKYRELSNNENLPYNNVHIDFKKDIKFDIQGKLHLQAFSDITIPNIKIINRILTSLETSFKPFLLTGAFAGLVSTVASAYLFGNRPVMAETAMHSIVPGMAKNYIYVGLFGTILGGLFGLAASYLSSFKDSDYKQSKHQENSL